MAKQDEFLIDEDLANADWLITLQKESVAEGTGYVPDRDLPPASKEELSAA